MRSRAICFGLLVGFLSVSVSENLIAQTSRVPVFFSICTGLPSADVVDFSSDVNKYTSVSTVSVVLSCGTLSPIRSGEQMLSVLLVMEGDALFLQVQPGANENASSEDIRRREIPWTHAVDGFIGVTRESGKIKTLALLIDNMVLDYAGIRLSPEPTEITDAFSVEYSVTDASADAAGTPAVMAHTMAATVDESAVRTVSCDCEQACEKKLAHLEMTLDALDAKSCAERVGDTQIKRDNRYTIVGAGGGVNVFTAGNRAPLAMLDVSLVRNRLGLVMRLGMEFDSSFEISDDADNRPFETRAGVLALGPAGFWARNRVLFSVQPLLVFRYWDVVRTDISEANHQRFMDMGPGVHGAMMLALGRVGGVVFRAGVQFFPAARRIVVENGPQRRIGMFHFPINLGFYLRF